MGQNEIGRSVELLASRRALSLVLMLCVASPALAAQDILTYRESDRQERLIEGAKAEGQLAFYSTLIVNQAMRPVVDAFQAKYPFLKMTYWRADSEDIVAKVVAEVRADNVVGDVLEGTGLGELAVAADIAQPYYTPVLAEYPEKYRDPHGFWTPTRLSYYSIAYNTKLVAADKVPKSYADLLDPQWRGKMAWRIGSSSGSDLFLANLRIAWGEEKAMDYFKRLAVRSSSISVPEAPARSSTE
jgi:ABC-type thiamine transport system substrate-binding protein